MSNLFNHLLLAIQNANIVSPKQLIRYNNKTFHAGNK